jgi:hypothetical protein
MCSRAGSAARENVSCRSLTLVKVMLVEKQTSSMRMVTSKNFVSVTGINLDFFECLKITCEVGIIIPAHCVDVCLRNFSSKSGVGF